MSVTRRVATPVPVTLAIRQRGPSVYVFVDGVGGEVTTTTAHRAGFDLVKLASESLPGECVVLKINGEGIDMPPPQGKQVGAALLRKSDAADDWQLLGK